MGTLLRLNLDECQYIFIRLVLIRLLPVCIMLMVPDITWVKIVDMHECIQLGFSLVYLVLTGLTYVSIFF